MRIVPTGTAFRVTDDCGTRTMVRLMPDRPTGKGPLAIATSAGLAITSIPEEASSCLFTACKTFVQCCVPCFLCFLEQDDAHTQWPWYKLVCDACLPPATDHGCPHVQAVVQTMPKMREETSQAAATCKRIAAWPSHQVGGSHRCVDPPTQRTCAVCLEDIDDEVISRCTTCQHDLHNHCLHKWVTLDPKVRCPLCRALWPVTVNWTPLWAMKEDTHDCSTSSPDPDPFFSHFPYIPYLHQP